MPGPCEGPSARIAEHAARRRGDFTPPIGAGDGVLHYDRDYDVLAEHAGLRFESRWVAAPGSLEDRPADSLRPLRRAITARLSQFSGPAAEDVYRRVIDLLDEVIADSGKPALPPPSRA